MKLSIMVCSTHNRYNTFLPKILDQLFGQLNQLPEDDKKQVEIITLIDNKTIMLGTKRNNLIDISKGEYLVFVDDDDRVSDDYIKSLLQATETNVDVITFTVAVSLNGEQPKPCFYSIEYSADFNAPDSYHRLPNHIMCVRRELAEQVKFKPVLYGEDSDYSKRLKPILKTQHTIDRMLYFYDYNLQTTEAQEYQREKRKGVCDVVILSNAKNSHLADVTRKCIKSLIASERQGIFNVIVIEQNKDLHYPGTETIHLDGEFNYNQFANEGIRKGRSPWICVANNDLVFHKHWFYQLMKVRADVMSPKSPGDRRQATIKKPTAGTIVGTHFSGWCFVMKRSIFERIGSLDEDFPFWCADNAVVEQFKYLEIEPVLVPDSYVTHAGSSTLKTLESDKHDELTRQQVIRFNKKYNQNLFNLGI